MGKSIEMSHVTFFYGKGKEKNLILKDVSARFEAGKAYAIIGHSGCGKSTTLALLGGMERPQLGEVLFNGKDIRKTGENEYRRKHMGIIFQNYNLLEYLTVSQNIRTAMDIKGTPKEHQAERIEELLRRVGLEPSLKDRKTASLSGGEQQRVAIARAISADADILLADEPTGNLDEEIAEGIIDLLLSLAHREGKCVIIVTHSPVVAECVDQVLRLEDGTLKEIL